MTPEAKIIESMFMIADKAGNDVPFILNNAQRDLDATFTGRDIIPKARQKGISTYYLARFTAACMAYRNTRAVVISHDIESTQRMLGKVHYFINNIRGPSPVIQNSSKNEITFTKTNSHFYIGTAGARAFGRGDTISHLHCSEIAYWPNPKDTMTGLMQAVPFDTGEVGIESTGKGMGNFYHNLCMRAAENKGRYRMHFYSWIFDKEYELKLTPDEQEHMLANLDDDIDEPLLMERYGVTLGQLAFRRMRLEELDYDMTKFKQEYPTTLDECFQASSDSIFKSVNHKIHNEWDVGLGKNLQGFHEHPKGGQNYIIGADVGAGVDKDNSVIEVFTFPQLEQVAEYASNTIQPDDFGDAIVKMAKYYNNAFIVCENNNYGILTMKQILKNDKNGIPVYDSTLVYRTEFGESRIVDYGFKTTAATRPMILGELIKLIKTDMTIYSDMLKGELTTFVQTDSGKAAADTNCNDDRVMACAMIAGGLKQAGLRLGLPAVEHMPDPASNPFSLDAIIKEMRGKARGGLPISDQTIH